MKFLHVPFTDEEFELLKERKRDRTWYEYILELSEQRIFVKFTE